MKIDNKSIPSIVAIGSAVLFAWLIWTWGFCRVYVAPNQMAVITAKAGKSLPSGRILAREGEKGIWQKVLGEGRYFFNPIFFDHEIFPVITIRPGQIGVVTSKIGEDLPAGEFLAEDNQKGIWKRVLGAGKYRINPYGYYVDIYSVLNIPVGFVGVVTSLSGTETKDDQFASLGQKGVMENILQPGLYYVNPKQFKVDVLEIGVNQVSLLGRQDDVYYSSQNQPQAAMQRNVNQYKQMQDSRQVEMQDQQVQMQMSSRGQGNSRAGKVHNAQLITKGQLDNVSKADIGSMSQSSIVSDVFSMSRGKDKLGKMKANQKMNMAMEQASPSSRNVQEKAQAIHDLDVDKFVEFPSKDGFHIMLDMTVEFELLPPAIASIYSKYGDLTETVQKIILPQILSISRLKGSEYKAKDFIMGEGREKFQQELKDQLAATLKEKNITIHSALIRHVVVPYQILEPIQATSVAIEENLTNIEKQVTARTLAKLNTEKMLIDQNKEKVEQETKKIEAEILAQMEKEVAMISAEKEKEVASIRRQVAILESERVRKLGKADADVKKMVGEASSDGFRLKVEAFGDPEAYSLFELAEGMSTEMTVGIIHAGEGTLWTDIDKTAAQELGAFKMLKK